MVVIERRLAGLLPYRMVFFADAISLRRIVEGLGPTEMARLFHSAYGLDGSRAVVRRERTLTVCNDLRQPLDSIWGGFASHNRAEIRKAERLGERVRVTRNGGAGFDDFLNVFNDFARGKDGVSPISGRLLRRYERYADRMVLYLDEQPTAVNLVLRDPASGRVRGIYSASRRLQAGQAKQARMIGNLNRLLHWHNVRLYKEEGFATYDWGGVGADRSDGRAEFKMSFGGEIREEYTYLCAGWPRLGRLARRMSELMAARRRGAAPPAAFRAYPRAAASRVATEEPSPPSCK